MKSNSLALEKLVIGREGAPLSAPIDLTLEAGELLTITGSNGSGKSTLLKMVAGLLPVESGAVRYNDSWPADPKPLYFGHKRGLTTSLSVHDNVALWAKACGQPELIEAALSYWDLDDIPNAKVESLSAGWQQRVALTRLVTVPAKLWLLDEPTANLDTDGIELLHSLIQTRLEQGGIILVATHLPFEGPKVRKLELSGLQQPLNVEVAC